MNKNDKIIYASDIEKRLGQIDDKLNTLRADLKGIRDQITTLEGHRAILANLLEDAILVGPDSPKNGNAERKTKQSSTSILLNYIITNPGQSTGEIVDSLEGVIESKSSDKRQMLYTMVSNLRRRGLVRRDESGKHYVVGRDE